MLIPNRRGLLYTIISKVLDWSGYRELEDVVKRSWLLSVLVGVIVFFVSFHLLGGNHPGVETVSTPAGHYTINELVSLISSLVATGFGFFITWYKVGVDRSLRRFEEKNEEQHQHLFKNIDILALSVSTLVERNDILAVSRRNLLRIQDDFLPLVGTDIDPSGKLLTFYTKKCRSFRDFANGLIEMGFEHVDTKGLMTSGEESAKAMHKAGNAIMGEEYMSLFYKEHGPAARSYLHNIVRIIEDSDNSVSERTRERSEQFMKDFSNSIVQAYMNYSRKL